MKSLNTRLDRLTQAAGGIRLPVWIRMDDGETEQQAEARWLATNADRRAELERHGARFVRRVIVEPAPHSLNEGRPEGGSNA